MILYHGSHGKYDILKRSQAHKAEGIDVPEKELQNAIYFSPDYGFALAMCSMPSGLTNVDTDNMTIKTEHPGNFNPKEKIYIYQIDSEKIPRDKLEIIDEFQVAVDLDELQYDSVKESVAGEVLNFYRFINE